MQTPCLDRLLQTATLKRVSVLRELYVPTGFIFFVLLRQSDVRREDRCGRFLKIVPRGVCA